MTLTENTQAVLLLTAYFSKPEQGTVKPLTSGEWGRFALWLKEQGFSPDQLLTGKLEEQLADWHDKTITRERITQLLDRGHGLGFALEKWQRAGIWVLTRSDKSYPKRLKARLKTAAPPLFFGVGNQALLNSGGLAIVGSRNASEEDVLFTEKLGEKAASASLSVVSGGARGIDETAMMGALKADGTVIGIMSDSLLKAATAKKWRQGLMENRLVLLSPFYPEAGFSVGNAMARNQYIYCMSDAAMVIHSGTKGGSWQGANENLKKAWVPLWVKPTTDQQAGNKDLVASGAHWCEADIDDVCINQLLALPESATLPPKTDDLFAQCGATVDLEDEANSTSCHKPEKTTDQVKSQISNTIENQFSPSHSFYQLFLKHLSQLCYEKPLTEDAISETLLLHKTQVRLWLKQAVDDDVLSKLTRPVRYTWKNESSSGSGNPA